MSRIGKKPIIIPEKVELTLEKHKIVASGPKGKIQLDIHPHVHVEKQENTLIVGVEHPEDHKDAALWGLFRNLIFNMVHGVTEGFSKELEINGIGFKAEVKKDILVLQVGYSHPVEYKIPMGIEIKVTKSIINVSGIDKQLVGQTAAEIREIKKPEPYKGKGIKYVDEVIRRKAGKAVTKSE